MVAKRDAGRHASRGTASAARFALLALVLGASARCSSSRVVVPVRVSDSGSGQPVAGAFVRAHPVDARHPLDVAAALNPIRPRSSSGRTDEVGLTRLSAPRDKPFQVFVTAPGFVPWGQFFDRPPRNEAVVAADLSPVASPLAR